MTPIIEAQDVGKRFGKVEALAGLDLVVEPGQVVALLLTAPDRGTVRVRGEVPPELNMVRLT